MVRWIVRHTRLARGRVFAAVLALACLVGAPMTVRAQASEAPVHEDVITANPFLLLFEWFNVEWEHRAAPNRTAGVAASYFSVDDGRDSYSSLAAFLRIFPQERAPSGFFMGGRVGGHRVNLTFDDDDPFALGIGIEMGYTWLLGSEENFVLSLGAGVTRLFSDAGDNFIPGIRVVNVGWAF